MKKIDFIATYIGLLLPYRLRIYYGFLLNFLLWPLNALKQLYAAVNYLLISALLFFVYYIGIPITILLKPRKKELFLKSTYQEIGCDSIFRMF